jgi:hypothetical protein
MGLMQQDLIKLSRPTTENFPRLFDLPSCIDVMLNCIVKKPGIDSAKPLSRAEA